MGLEVTVVPQFHADASRTGIYVFSYQITLYNPTQLTIQLLRRHWVIREASGEVTEVEGEGVVGLQPVIAPLERFEYSSWVQVKSLPSVMQGEYSCMQDTVGMVQVPIPAFTLRLPGTVMH